MIYGVGTDIVQIARIETALANSGQRFAQKILGDEELIEFEKRRQQSDVRAIRYLATRFAAKEAFSKAIGTGIRAPMTWHNLQVKSLESGQPILQTVGVLGEWMRTQNLNAKISLSDELEYAVAFVIVEQINHHSNH